jgi:hypothetical protein
VYTAQRYRPYCHAGSGLLFLAYRQGKILYMGLPAYRLRIAFHSAYARPDKNYYLRIGLITAFEL